MEMSRFMKIIWSVNGILILMLFLLIGFLALRDLLRSFGTGDSSKVIVGEELKKAKDAGLVLQGIEYDEPVRIYGSSGFFLPVRIKTYNTPKKSSPAFDFDSRQKLKIERVDYSSTVNVIFLDKDFKVTHTLLDKAAFINSYRYPSSDLSRYRHDEILDSTIQVMTYRIAFEDSNHDGTINEDDHDDLYISTLDGHDLYRVTNGLDLIQYDFISFGRILISFTKPGDQIEEHKRKHLAVFDLKSRKFEELTSIDKEFDKIEDILTK